MNRKFKKNLVFVLGLVMFLGIIINNYVLANNDDVSVSFTSEVIDSGKGVELSVDVIKII